MDKASERKTKKPVGKPVNRAMLQGFEWYLNADGEHWNRLRKNAQLLKDIRINMLWLPPAYKGMAGANSVGYDVYDKYDLGDCDQKGSVRTKYGTREEYEQLLAELNARRIDPISDMVMNHMFAGDEKESVQVRQVNPADRKEIYPEVFSKEFNSHFTFAGRNGKYNTDEWNSGHFSGLDQDGPDWDLEKKDGENLPERDRSIKKLAMHKDIYLIDGKSFTPDVDWEFGNYDFLMGCNLDFSNSETRQRTIEWGKWYLTSVGKANGHIQGVRLDAVKHISNDFLGEWLEEMRSAVPDRELFAVGEYWHGNDETTMTFFDRGDIDMNLFDVSLHFNLQNASNSDGKYDMRKLTRNCLLSDRPENAVTFVDNHDTQPGQALTSYVLHWFKQQAYAAILFQKKGVPCVFYGDLFGLHYDNYRQDIEDRRQEARKHVADRCSDDAINRYYEILPYSEEFAPVEGLPKMIRTRCTCAHGGQKTYDNGDNPNLYGYVRHGLVKYKYSGMAVLITNKGEYGQMEMYVNLRFAGKTMIDILHPEDENRRVTLNEEGKGIFKVDGNAMAGVWVLEEAYHFLKKEKGFRDHLY